MTDVFSASLVIISEARGVEAPTDVIRPAVAAMLRQDVEALAVAYLLSEVRKTPAPARPVVPAQPGIAKPTPAMLEAQERIVRRNQEQERDSRETFKQTVDKAFAILKYEWQFEWTQEILSAAVVLPDGGTVQFGDATRAQHVARAKAHRTNTLRNMEAAVRHEKALETLNRAGVDTLNEALVGAR